MCLGCAYPAGLGFLLRACLFVVGCARFLLGFCLVCLVFVWFCWCLLVFCLLVPWMLLGFARFLRGCCFPGAASPEVSPGRAALGGAAREGRPRPRRAHPQAASEHRGGFPGALPPGAAAPEAAPRRRSSRGGPLCRPRRSPRARRSPSGAGHTGGTHGRVAPPVVDYCSGSASESCFRGLAWISAAPCFCPVCPPRLALWFCALARLRFVRLFARRPAA